MFNGSINISNAYATGEVIGGTNVGGLIGDCEIGTITNVYCKGKVTGEQYVGGLIGKINYPTITNAYTISKVIGGNNVGGLAAYKDSYRYNPTITDSYWSNEISEVDTSLYGTCLTLENMKKQSSYQNWDFSSGTVWRMNEYPELILDINIEE